VKEDFTNDIRKFQWNGNEQVEMRMGHDKTHQGEVNKVLDLLLDLPPEAGVVVRREGVAKDLHT